MITAINNKKTNGSDEVVTRSILKKELKSEFKKFRSEMLYMFEKQRKDFREEFKAALKVTEFFLGYKIDKISDRIDKLEDRVIDIKKYHDLRLKKLESKSSRIN